MNLVKCYDCGNKYPPFYNMSLSIKGSKHTINICHDCNNKRMAKKYGVELMELQKMVFVMKDDKGQDHILRVRKKIKPRYIIIEAQEFIDGEIKGYNFEVTDDLHCDQINLEKELYKKVQDGLANKSIEKDIDLGDLANNKVTGMISCDENSLEDVPVVIINGKEYSWQKFGEMMKSYEGWHFKLELE